MQTWLRYTAVLALLSAGPAWAQIPPPPEVTIHQKPDLARQVGIDQKLGAALPLDAMLKDETGKDVRLGEYFGDKPVVLAFVYYECPMLCTLILNGLFRAMTPMTLRPNTDFEVVAISIDHEETFVEASRKKEAYLKEFGKEGYNEGIHFLTGPEATVKQIAGVAGFRYAYDEERGEYAHASAIMVTTPDGKLSRYFYGVEYSSRDLRLGLVEASEGTIGNAVDAVLLYCYHYDPMSGKYGVVVMNILRLSGGLLLLLLGGFIALSIWRDRNKSSDGGHSKQAQQTS